MYLKTQKTSLCFPPRDLTSLFQGEFMYIQTVLSGMPRCDLFLPLPVLLPVATLTCFSGVCSRKMKSQGTPSLNLWREWKQGSRGFISPMFFWADFISLSEEHERNGWATNSISSWCSYHRHLNVVYFLSSCVYSKTGKLKSTRSVPTQNLLWPPKNKTLIQKMDYLLMWQDKELLCADKAMILHPA